MFKASATTNDTVIAFWDILPTCAGLRAWLRRRGSTDFSQAVRLGNWKGVRPKSRSAAIELYDVVKDPGESQNVAAAHPDMVKRIAEIMVSARTESKTFPVKEL